ncbi:hypothetical protein VKT23_015560 [Stygiomarasmius scandens]|uniref:Uncharacterized protein n=1 Tax=Marasmiellus scandens TaxID=2682957 RepID=A0ABR1IZM5_9AGAR
MTTNIGQSAVSNARQGSKDALEKIRKLINESEKPGKQDSKEKSNQRSRKILDALQEGVKYAAIIAEANDIAKGVVGIFASVLEREVKRRKNDEEIVVVYYALASAMFCIRHIEKARITEESLKQELESHFEDMKSLITKFGKEKNQSPSATAVTFPRSKPPCIGGFQRSRCRRAPLFILVLIYNYLETGNFAE